MDQSDFSVTPWISQPTKLGLKVGSLLGIVRPGTQAAKWHVSLSWGFLAVYNSEKELVSTIDLRGANIDLVAKDSVTITSRNGVFFTFYPQSEEERKDWVMAIGALMQVHQSHWKDHEIVPVFELLAARIMQLTSIARVISPADIIDRLTNTCLSLMVSYTWNSPKRNDKITLFATEFIQIIKTLMTNKCPTEITDAYSTIARQVVKLANMPIPTLTKSNSNSEIKPISFGPTSPPSASSIKLAAASSSKSSKSPRSDEVGSTAIFSSLPSPGSSNTVTVTVNSPTAGRRGAALKNSVERTETASPMGSSSGSKLDLSPSASGASEGTGHDSASKKRPVSEESAVRVRALETAETQQEQILRLVKDVRALFVKSVEAFKSGNLKNFEATVSQTEKLLDTLRVTFDILLTPLESHAVRQRLGETPDRYYWSWKRAVEVVRKAFAEPDRTAAMTMLREELPAVGDAMGQASHILCGAVFEAAQQVYSEQELKSAASLFFDLETSRVAKFLSALQLKSTAPSPPLIGAHSLQNEEFLEFARKTLLSAQTMVKLCQNSFFDVTSPSDHTKHLDILERLITVVDKLASDIEAPNSVQGNQNLRAVLLEAIYAARDFGQVATSIVEAISELDANPRLSLSTISPQQAIKNLASTRGSTQSISSRLNATQMRFSTACKQLSGELEHLLDLMPDTAIDESKLSIEQLRARRSSIAPVATYTRFILHNQATGDEGRPTSSIASVAAYSASSSSHSLSNSLPVGTKTHSSGTSQATASGNFTTWSGKFRPNNSGVEIPRLATDLTSSTSALPMSSPARFAANSGSSDSPRKDSPSSASLSPLSASSGGGPDSLQWRKSVKSRDDPVSPRADSNSPSLAASNTSGQTPGSPSSSSMSSLPLGSLAAANTGYSSTSPPVSPSRKMQTLTVVGVEVQYPETINIWLEPEEGNFKFLKGSELESEHSVGNMASSPPNSNSSRNLVHSKAQSSITLGRNAAPSASNSPGSGKNPSSDTDSIASLSAPKLSNSSSQQALPQNASRARLNAAEPILASATLNRLIVKLTSESTVDVLFMKSFLATYRSFTTPEELWGKLLERYNVPPKPKDSPLSDEAYKQSFTLPIHLRVSNVIGMWLATNWTDISPNLMVHIEYFIDHTLPRGEAKGLQKKMRSAFEKAQTDRKFLEFQENARYGRVRAGGQERARAFRQVMMTARAARLDPFMVFLEDDVEPQAVAEQLTMLDWQLYSKITYVELLNKSWSRDDKNVSPNVRGMIQRFNEVSSWVATSILWQGTMEERVRVYTRIIQTAQALFKLNNFNATLAIISGLNNAAVHRLKFTFNELQKRERGTLALLMEKMSSKSSYKEYRELLKRVSPPKIPYLGVYLTDLTFIEDGNPNNIGHLINFHKRRLVHRVLQDIEQYQDTPFNIHPDNRLSFTLSKLTFMDDNELYNLSLIREPRGCERSDIH